MKSWNRLFIISIMVLSSLYCYGTFGKRGIARLLLKSWQPKIGNRLPKRFSPHVTRSLHTFKQPFHTTKKSGFWWYRKMKRPLKVGVGLGLGGIGCHYLQPYNDTHFQAYEQIKKLLSLSKPQLINILKEQPNECINIFLTNRLSFEHAHHTDLETIDTIVYTLIKQVSTPEQLEKLARIVAQYDFINRASPEVLGEVAAKIAQYAPENPVLINDMTRKIKYRVAPLDAHDYLKLFYLLRSFPISFRKLFDALYENQKIQCIIKIAEYSKEPVTDLLYLMSPMYDKGILDWYRTRQRNRLFKKLHNLKDIDSKTDHIIYETHQKLKGYPKV